MTRKHLDNGIDGDRRGDIGHGESWLNALKLAQCPQDFDLSSLAGPLHYEPFPAAGVPLQIPFPLRPGRVEHENVATREHGPGPSAAPDHRALIPADLPGDCGIGPVGADNLIGEVLALVADLCLQASLAGLVDGEAAFQILVPQSEPLAAFAHEFRPHIEGRIVERFRDCKLDLVSYL